MKILLLGFLLLPVRWVPGEEEIDPFRDFDFIGSPFVREPPFLSMEIGGYPQSGILIDRSGLILVNKAAATPWDRYARVRLRDDRGASVQHLATNKHPRHSWFRVHPDVVQEIRPYPWAASHPEGSVVSVGDAVTFHCPFRNKTLLSLAKTVTEVEKSSFRIDFDPEKIVFPNQDTPWSPSFCAVLNGDRDMVGFFWTKTFFSKKYVILNLVGLRERMEKARIAAGERDLPAPGVFPLKKIDSLPPDVRRELPVVDPSDSPYHLPHREIKLEVITPPVMKDLMAREEPWIEKIRPRNRDKYSIYHPERGFFRWSRWKGALRKVVIIQAIPGLRITPGSVAEMTGGIILAPLTCGQSLEGIDRRHHFHPEFAGMILMKDGIEIEPARHYRVCGPFRVLVVKGQGGKAWKDYVAGCYGAYLYPTDAFAGDDGSFSMQVFTGKGDESITISLPQETVSRIRADLAPLL